MITYWYPTVNVPILINLSSRSLETMQRNAANNKLTMQHIDLGQTHQTVLSFISSTNAENRATLYTKAFFTLSTIHIQFT